MSWKGDQKIEGLKLRFLEVVTDLVINLVGEQEKWLELRRLA